MPKVADQFQIFRKRQPFHVQPQPAAHYETMQF